LLRDISYTITNLVVQAERDPARVSLLYSDAVKELAVLRRSAIVNQLYGGWRLAVEDEGKDGVQ
jgi:LYR motif-containing protein 4